jgi:hypothetical protein
MKDISYDAHDDSLGITREDLEAGLRQIVHIVFKNKKIKKDRARRIFDGSERIADLALNRLRQSDVLKVEGERRGAVWTFTDNWVEHDHEVVGA